LLAGVEVSSIHLRRRRPTLDHRDDAGVDPIEHLDSHLIFARGHGDRSCPWGLRLDQDVADANAMIAALAELQQRRLQQARPRIRSLGWRHGEPRYSTTYR
jgi:hypothetical protein